MVIETRDDQLSFRVRPRDGARIRAAAEAEHKRIGEWLRDVILAETAKIERQLARSGRSE